MLRFAQGDYIYRPERTKLICKEGMKFRATSTKKKKTTSSRPLFTDSIKLITARDWSIRCPRMTGNHASNAQHGWLAWVRIWKCVSSCYLRGVLFFLQLSLSLFFGRKQKAMSDLRDQDKSELYVHFRGDNARLSCLYMYIVYFWKKKKCVYRRPYLLSLMHLHTPHCPLPLAFHFPYFMPIGHSSKLQHARYTHNANTLLHFYTLCRLSWLVAISV